VNLEGAALAAFALVVIAIFHPLVIWAEYRFGARACAPVFALVGLGTLTGALFLPGAWGAGCAFFGATNLWCVVEVFAQQKRVEKGWFPKNPKWGPGPAAGDVFRDKKRGAR